MHLSTLALATATLFAPSPNSGGSDATDAVLEALDEGWDRIDGVELTALPYRDKTRLVGDLDELLERERASDRDRKRLAKALVRRLEQSDSPHLDWRLHELHARILEPLDDEAACEARLAAVAAYPANDYADPSKQSSFHHLANEATVALWATEGYAVAQSWWLETLADERLEYVYFDPLEAHAVTAGAAAELAGLQAATAAALAERLPELAAELERRPPIDARYVGGDRRKLYVLLGGEVETQAPRDLVVVMAGGNGQAMDFLPWLRDLTAPLTDRYLFAVLSAPVWSDDQAESVVWVTERWKREFKAKFTVEAFAREAAAELHSQIDGLGRSFLFAWSSGGPATYATVLDRDGTFAGAYVLASVFKPEQLDLKRAKGRRFFLEQGRSDRVTALHFAETAERKLRDKGATVRLEAFDGGHGFAMSDPHRSLARALDWLAAEAN